MSNIINQQWRNEAIQWNLNTVVTFGPTYFGEVAVLQRSIIHISKIFVRTQKGALYREVAANYFIIEVSL